MGIVDTQRSFRDYALWEALRGITPQDIIHCLEGHGWVRGESFRAGTLLYTAPVHDDFGQEITVVLPEASGEPDAYLMAEAIEWVALIAGMTIPEVMGELRNETFPKRLV